MFVSFLGLFVSHSSVGIGTIIGSEIFNHMCISAGSVMCAEGGVLKLDPQILTREALAYLSSLILLIWVLEGNSMGADVVFNQAAWSTNCLSVKWYGAFVLVLCYAVYAVIAANFGKVCKFLCGYYSSDLADGEKPETVADVYNVFHEQGVDPQVGA